MAPSPRTHARSKTAGKNHESFVVSESEASYRRRWPPSLFGDDVPRRPAFLGEKQHMAVHPLDRTRRLLRSEAALWVLGFVLAVVGHLASHAIVDGFEGRWSPAAALSICGFVALTLAFYSLYRNPLPERVPGERRWRVFWREAWPWLFGAAAGISTFGLAVSIRDIGGEASNWVYLAGWTVAILVFGSLLYRQRTKLLIAHTRELSQKEITGRSSEPCRHIVWLLSTVTINNEPWLSNHGLPECLPACDDRGRTLAEDWELLKDKKVRWNWEMLGHGIQPHASATDPTVVTLLCSRESLPQAGWAAAMLRRYREFVNVTVRVWTVVKQDGKKQYEMVESDDSLLGDPQACDGVPFNDFDKLSIAVSHLLKYIHEQDGAPAKTITMDITGGQKPASLVAGAVTFRGESKTQYVDTGGTKPVFEYDVMIDPEPKGA